MKKEFKNQHRILESCNGRSKVISLGEYSPYRTGTVRRFIFLHCGLNKESVPKKNCFNQAAISHGKVWENGFIIIGGPFDWFFGYPLYLQISCCGHVLWAYNLEHLGYIKKYVEAEL